MIDCGDSDLTTNNAWTILVISSAFNAISFLIKLSINTTFTVIFALDTSKFLAFSKPPDVEVELDWIK